MKKENVFWEEKELFWTINLKDLINNILYKDGSNTELIHIKLTSF